MDGSGKAERYQIVIDTEAKTIAAHDQVRGQLWEMFSSGVGTCCTHPSRNRGEPYQRPALVYSEIRRLVIDSVPTVCTLLGLGEKQEMLRFYKCWRIEYKYLISSVSRLLFDINF